MRLRLLSAACAGLTLGWAPVPARAVTTDPYSASVARASALVEQAREGNPAAARQALAELRKGTGETQPEVLADLSREPPDLDDAAARLRALSSALETPADTSDPEIARSRLAAIMAESRYDALKAGQNPVDRFVGWLVDLLARALAGAGLPSIPWLEQALLLLGVLLVGAAAAWLLVALRGRAGGDASGGLAAARPREHVDHFAEADRLAGTGDFTQAVRELAAGVAVRLGGDEAWDASPLTVRELFGRAPHPGPLRPLLLGFERAAYAGRTLDRDAYEAAAGAAGPYRGPVVQAA